MRMRKKKNLTERLDAVKDYIYISESEDRNFKTAVNNKDYIDFNAWFGKDAPLFLEVGCGKGRFACEYAAAHPEINLIAVEKEANVIVAACELAKNMGLNNVKFIKCSAEYLERHIKPNSIERIFLNFSCPFPKNTYASHRLTHKNFLEIYKRIIKSGAEIHQKTDNMHFFEFSIEQFTNNGFALKNVSLDLHNSNFEGNIMTEYEQKFVTQGLPIYRLEAYLKEE
ncbi:MAG: tRNA (guanosine(46)-N7)-methyltransferase TrmB [Acutalibacteraceae bacterium]|nr:tRNA (guanosine(46)-N7)-methyltransferase TrmB [Acutalibacteraceae bacterium]